MNSSFVAGEQEKHAVLPVPSGDEFARQEFVKSLKYHLSTRVAPGIRDSYEKRRAPEFQARAGAGALQGGHRCPHGLAGCMTAAAWTRESTLRKIGR